MNKPMRAHVSTRDGMYQSAIVLVRCVSLLPPSPLRRAIGKREDPGDEVVQGAFLGLSYGKIFSLPGFL